MTRTVLIGLDGATFTVLDALTAGNEMPFLRDFVASGTRATLLSTVNPLTAQAWPAMMTGCHPGRHGIIDFVHFEERENGGYFTVTGGRDLRRSTVWELASDQACRVTALNFFGTFPPPHVNGHVVGGFVPWRHLRRAVSPPALYERLLSIPGLERRELAMDLDLEKKCIDGLPDEEYEAWITLHIRREQQWMLILRHLAATDPADLTGIVFDGVDKLQHLCWRFIDPALVPARPTRWERRVHALCLEYFRQLDAQIAEIVSLAGPEARILIASDHGFGPTTEVVHINVWLHDRGYLAWAGGAATDGGGRLAAPRLKTHASMIDWAGTTAYAVTPSGNGIAIRVAGAGRPGGIAPEDYHGFRRRLVEELLAFRDPDDGMPVITHVRTREEAYPGYGGSAAPDLLLTLRDGGFVSVLDAERALVRRPVPAGTHRPEGILLCRGPGIRRGTSIDPVSIVDIAPTLLHSLGLTTPPDLDGVVADAIFEPEWLAAHPVRTAVRARAPRGSAEPDDEPFDDTPVLERLRALGYIE